jgi:hypothetical protein
MSRIFTRASSVGVWLGDDCAEALQALAKDTKADRQDLVTFSKATYWRRIWTIQEFELAKRVIFMAGNIVTDLENVLPNIRELIRKDTRITIPIYDLEHEEDLAHRLLKRGYAKYGNSLETLMLRYRGMECEDPRDSVYGLLGLAEWTGAKANYALSAKQLCEALERGGFHRWCFASALRNAAGMESGDVDSVG